MDGTTLAELRARRAALDEEIRAAEKRQRDSWNNSLWDCENALTGWMREHSAEHSRGNRKNETSYDIGHGALTAVFGEDDGEHPPRLRLESGRTLTLEWSEVPEPDRFLAIVAVLLGEGPR